MDSYFIDPQRSRFSLGSQGTGLCLVGHLPRGQEGAPWGQRGLPGWEEAGGTPGAGLRASTVSGRSSSGPSGQGLMVQHVVVVDVHEHGHRLPDDECQPHGRVAIVAPEEAAHDPGQWDLGTQGQSGGRGGHGAGCPRGEEAGEQL